MSVVLATDFRDEQPIFLWKDFHNRYWIGPCGSDENHLLAYTPLGQERRTCCRTLDVDAFLVDRFAEMGRDMYEEGL